MSRHVFVRDLVPVKLALLLLAVCAIWMAGCGSSIDEVGPGPVGPGDVGPGEVGPGAVGPGEVGPVDAEAGQPGSGNIVTEPRTGLGFTRVLFESVGDVTVTRGAEHSIVVEADDNLLGYLETTVEEDILRVSTTENMDIAPSRSPQFRITMPEVSEVELSGVGNVDVDVVDSEIFSVALTGVGDITVGSVDVDLLLFDVSGVGNVTLEGKASEQRGVVHGPCQYLAEDLETERTMLQASGGSSTVIWVTVSLDVEAVDLADVAFYGSPDVSQTVGDLASITALGQR